MQKLYVFVSDYEQISIIFKLYPKHQFMWDLFRMNLYLRASHEIRRITSQQMFPSLDNRGKKRVPGCWERLFAVAGESRVVFKNKMQPTNPNAHTYVNGTDVETHGYAVT